MFRVLYILAGAVATSLALTAALLVAYQRIETSEEKATIRLWFQSKLEALERSRWASLPQNFTRFVIDTYNTQQDFVWKMALIFIRMCTIFFLVGLFYLWLTFFHLYGFDSFGRSGDMSHSKIAPDYGDLLLGLAFGVPLLFGVNRMVSNIAHGGAENNLTDSSRTLALRRRTPVILLSICFLALALSYVYLVSLLVGICVEWIFQHPARVAAILSFSLIPISFLICLPINVCLPPSEIDRRDRQWVEEVLARYPRGLGAIGLLLIFRVVTGKASPSLPVKKYQLYTVGISVSGILTAIAFLVGSLMEPGSPAPTTKQFIAINAICDISAAMLFYRNLRSYARSQVGVAGVMSKSIAQPGVLALLAAYFGLMNNASRWSASAVLWWFIAHSTDGTSWEFGAIFWAMHTTFLPILGIVIGLVVCCAMKTCLVLSKSFLGRALLQHNDPINATAGILACLGAVFAVISLWAKIYE